jgi:hypothetical protein
MTAAFDETFPHFWQAEILPRRPPILPPRRFTYPATAEEAERGALEVIVRPRSGQSFLATFALGFADPAATTGVWSCPNSDELCAVAGGYAYVVQTGHPERFTHLRFRPVFAVRPLPDQGLLLFAGSHALLAWGARGLAWESARLSSEGLRIVEVAGQVMHGFGWDMATDREVPFAIDLRTGAQAD